MNFVETSFKINSNSKIASLISWKRFKSDEDFLETLEDLFFWEMINKWDNWNYVSKEEILNSLNQNIWK